MQISKREFLKRLGLGAAGVVASPGFADERVPSSAALPPGSCGDPNNVHFGRNIFPLEPTMTDGPSCFLREGKVLEPAHEIPVFHETDVVVVGGGPSGFAAAVAAARTGAKVALVERYGSLGGLFTNGMVLLMIATSRYEDGKYALVTRGICEEFMNRAAALGGDFCTMRLDRNRHQPTVDPEAAKFLMDEMIAESGVEMFFHCWGIDVIQEGPVVRGIVFESKEGRKAILARQVVDCTGDADMLFRAGGSYRQITHAIGFVSRWAGMSTINPPPDSKARFPRHGNEGNPDTHWQNALGPKGNGLSVRDLSAAEVAHRRANWRAVMKMRGTPGWEKVYTANTCSQIGPRATRLVDTEFVIGRNELRKGFALPDPIGWLGVDGPYAAFAIPYRAIVPKGVENLLCAGRCLGTGDTTDTFRLICPCFVTGQAAGIAAALSAKAGTSPRELSYGVLRRELEKQKVYLG